ncbi:MAG: AAA family ATPase [Promethearchaeota archaeon]
MKELVIPIGPAGCGKSTYQMKNYPHYTLMSPDLIRFKILDSENTKIYFDYEFEPQVWKQVYILFEEALNRGDNIFFDGTNLTQKFRYPLVCRALRKSYKIHMIYFKIPLEVALERNRKRERKVREEVIKEQYEILEPPEPWEYDKLTIISK